MWVFDGIIKYNWYRLLNSVSKDDKSYRIKLRLTTGGERTLDLPENTDTFTRLLTQHGVSDIKFVRT